MSVKPPGNDKRNHEHIAGTTLFLSENLTEPIIKINEYTSGMRRLMRSLGLSAGNPSGVNSFLYLIESTNERRKSDV
jgi:hypothetical protein